MTWLQYQNPDCTPNGKTPNTYGTMMSLFFLRVWTFAASKYSTGDSGLAFLWETDIKTWRMAPQLSLVIKKKKKRKKERKKETTEVCVIYFLFSNAFYHQEVNELKLTYRRLVGYLFIHLFIFGENRWLGHSSWLKQMPFTQQNISQMLPKGLILYWALQPMTSFWL